jgi:hypothetical protein
MKLYEFFQVFLIYSLPDSRFPFGAPYTKEEALMSKRFIELYQNFATTSRPIYGGHTLQPIGRQLMGNEIWNSSYVHGTAMNSTFGNSDFWKDLLE